MGEPTPDTLAAKESSAILSTLNPQQRAAVSHGDGPLLIVAGAGTGKTTTLAHRVAHLVAQGADPRRILLLTFTRRAAAEMMRRVDALLMPPALREPNSPGTAEVDGGSEVAAMPHVAGRLWGGTFHAIASRLLRVHGRDLGLLPDFTILDRADAEDLMHVCRTELGLSAKRRRFPQKSTCLDIYSRCVNARTPLAEVLATAFPWCRDDEDDLKRLFGDYTERKEVQQVLDYDDLLVFWAALLRDPASGPRVRERFDHVLVDEYQDTNALQAEIVALMRPDGTGVTAVGDDAQAIYSFRSASVRNILDFELTFPDATVMVLERNYRSTQPILDATNAIIGEATEWREKALFTEREGGARPVVASCRDEVEQTEYVIERILEHRERGTLLKEQAVLFRAAHHSAALEIGLSRRNIPFFKYGGLKFVEMAHVKDLLAYLRLAANPKDQVAGMRVLGLLPGVGPKTASDLMAALAQTDGDFERAWLGFKPPEATRGAWPGFVTLMRGLSAEEPGSLPAQVHATRTYYTPLLAMRYDNAEARARDLEQIENLAARYPSRDRLLAELALDPPAYTQDLAGPPYLDEDYLILSTIHSAKGLEWDAVYVIHAADGNIPSDMATGSAEEIEEERRLFYVACTRARDDLYITWPFRYYSQPFGRSDTHGFAQRSRFITSKVASFVRDVQASPEPASDDAAVTGACHTTTASVRAGLKAMWE